MPAPTPLSIATSSVQRLLKEETYYYKELAAQRVRVEGLEMALRERTAAQAENEDHENDEFMLNQEKRAMEETMAVFGPLRSRIADAVAKLEEQVAIGDSEGADAAELTKARDVLKEGQDALKEEA